jgi:hypothetical protein
MLPERMRARRAPSSGEARSTTIVATHGPIVAGPNAGTRITTRHVNPTPAAAFALNSAKANAGLLCCCCWVRVCKGYNREKEDGRQITHCVCPSVDGFHPIGEPLALLGRAARGSRAKSAKMGSSRTGRYGEHTAKGQAALSPDIASSSKPLA